ncbi:MAG TPA: flavin reductase family protein [Acidimicrobiales bacterium]|nr:flavin reductase family protein [Acidimicrobiales bacterium]
MSDHEDEIVDVGAADIDAARFRTVVGHFASGVAIITGADGEGPSGFTCQSFFSQSLDPPLVVISPGKSSTSWPRIGASGAFCVNFLTEEQEALCRAFASSGGDKFRCIGWRPGPTGSPILADVLGWVDCRIERSDEAGDHLLVVGRVVDMGAGPGEPLVFYRGGFGGFRA